MSINAYFNRSTTEVGEVVALIQAFVPYECWQVHSINERMNCIVIHVPGTTGHVELGYTLGRPHDRPVLTLRHAGPSLANVLDMLAAIVGDTIIMEGGGHYTGFQARRHAIQQFAHDKRVYSPWEEHELTRAERHDFRRA